MDDTVAWALKNKISFQKRYAGAFELRNFVWLSKNIHNKRLISRVAHIHFVITSSYGMHTKLVQNSQFDIKLKIYSFNFMIDILISKMSLYVYTYICYSVA